MANLPSRTHRVEYPPPPDRAAGWYEEPRSGDAYRPSGAGWRFWDGEQWTAHWSPANPEQGPNFIRGAAAGESSGRPSGADWYDDPRRPGTEQQRYWNGSAWTDDVRPGIPAAVTERKTIAFAIVRGLFFAGIFGVLLLLLWLIGAGRTSDDAEPQPESGEPAAVIGGESDDPDECPSEPGAGQDQFLDAEPSAEPCGPGAEPGTPAPAPTTDIDTAPVSAAAPDDEVGESPGACLARTFDGTISAGFESAPVGGTEHATSEFVIGSDCTTRVSIVRTESGADDAFVSTKNPDGSFCAMLVAEGSLLFTPDGSGGGSLAGTLTLHPNIASSHHFEGACPEPDDVEIYVAGPVNAEFSGTVVDGTLTGGGTFPHDQLPVSITVEATRVSG